MTFGVTIRFKNLINLHNDLNMTIKNKILIIQPIVPHYRIPFFDRLSQIFNILILYSRSDLSFKIKHRKYIKKVRSLNIGKIELFFVFHDLLRFRPDIVITYGEVKQLTNVLLFFLKCLVCFKLIIWSHGFKDKKLSFVDKIRLFEMRRADGVIFYTENCFKDAKKYNLKKSYYLNNTLEMCETQKNDSELDIIKMKIKYDINTKTNGVFISRFTKAKAPELLLKIMIESHKKNREIGFIIIGDGEYKPDFSKYNFIYDFGRVYDEGIKTELFEISDFSIMPRWIGLSIIECFTFKLPMFTLSNEIDYIEHSVEYSYLRHNQNGYIAKDIKELVEKISNIDTSEIKAWGENGHRLVTDQLNMDNMVKNFSYFINKLRNKDKKKEILCSVE